MTPISDDQIAALVDAADKATPGDLDSAEKIRNDVITCPLCGDGDVDRKMFLNIDGQAIGVEIFGVGEAFGHYETFARLANPTTIRALASRVQADAAVIAGLREEVERLKATLEWYGGSARMYQAILSSPVLGGAE